MEARLRDRAKPKRYTLSDEYDVGIGDWVVVTDEEEEDCAVLTSRPIPLPVEWEDIDLPRIIDVPDEGEIEKTLRTRDEKEPEAIKKAYEKVRSRDLDMKLVQARYFQRSNKMKFHFTAENRVDFRELVKDLASIFHARIEMRQIGVRDAAGVAGGYGICGQELCCSRFLKGFDPITIRMAKDQNLALNPSKISGCCGRLLCCLKYEHETYAEAKRHYPRNGTQANWEDRQGRVNGYNILKETVSLALESQVIEIPLEQFKRENPAWRNPSAGKPAVEETVEEVPEEESLKGLEDVTEHAGPRDPRGDEGGESSGRRRRRRRRNRGSQDREPSES